MKYDESKISLLNDLEATKNALHEATTALLYYYNTLQELASKHDDVLNSVFVQGDQGRQAGQALDKIELYWVNFGNLYNKDIT